MAGTDLRVSITAQDGASAVFAKVADSAKTMGGALSEIGSKGGDGIDSFSAKVKSLDSEISTVGKTLTVAGAAVTAFMGLSANKSMGLESAMANVNSVAHLSDGELAKLTKTVTGLSVELGASPTGLAEGQRTSTALRGDGEPVAARLARPWQREKVKLAA